MSQDELYRALGQRVRDLRLAERLSQQELADRVNLTRVSIANIEKGRQRPPVHFFYEVANSLNANVVQIFVGTEDCSSCRMDPAISEEEALIKASIKRATPRHKNHV